MAETIANKVLRLAMELDEGGPQNEWAGILQEILDSLRNSFDEDVALAAATHLVLPLHNDPTTPTLAFGDGNTGFYESADNELFISNGGVLKWRINAVYLGSSTDTGGGGIRRETASNTNPVLTPSYSDEDTGMGWAAADQLSLIAGGVEQLRLTQNDAAADVASFSGIVAGSVDSITATDAGVAASIATMITLVTTNSDQDLDNVTLADGVTGQMKTIVCEVEGDAGDTWKVTPAHMVGGTQITFATAGEGCTLVWSASGWIVSGNNGGTIT